MWILFETCSRSIAIIRDVVCESSVAIVSRCSVIYTFFKHVESCCCIALWLFFFFSDKSIYHVVHEIQQFGGYCIFTVAIKLTWAIYHMSVLQILLNDYKLNFTTARDSLSSNRTFDISKYVYFAFGSFDSRNEFSHICFFIENFHYHLKQGHDVIIPLILNIISKA